MTNAVQRGLMALTAGWRAGWDVAQQTWSGQTWLTPPGIVPGVWFNDPDRAAVLRAWYSNTIFEDRALSQALRQRMGLYRHIRPLYNPVRRLVDFYAAGVYPGMLSEDGKRLPQGIPSAIPLAEDTPPALKAAIAQAWQWGAWQSRKTQIVRRAAIYGDLLVEIVDDTARGKVYPQLVRSDQIADLTLDAQGAIKRYVQAYYYRDPPASGPQYLYTRIVTRDGVQTFRDEAPYGYAGLPPAYELPYGFVPAVWVRHKEDEGDHGQPAAEGSYNKIAHLMALAAHVHDQVHKVITAGRVFYGTGNIQDMAVDPDSDAETAEATEADSLLWLQGPADGHSEPLVGALPLDQALSIMQDLQAEIERDHPPLRVWEQLRAMSTIHGPAANRLLGDAAAPLYEAEATYDQRVQQILQMTVAIAGMRYAEGAEGWAARTRQQAKFAPFNLDSYNAGDLDFAILPRPLVAPTFAELLDDQTQEYAALQAAQDANIPLSVALRRAQWSAQDTADVLAEEAARQERAAQLTAQFAGGDTGQQDAQQQEKGNGEQP